MRTRLLSCIFLLAIHMQVNAQVPAYLIKSSETLSKLEMEFKENQAKRIFEMTNKQKEEKDKAMHALKNRFMEVKSSYFANDSILESEVEKKRKEIKDFKSKKLRHWLADVKEKEEEIDLLMAKKQEVHKEFDQLKLGFINDSLKLANEIVDINDGGLIKIKRQGGEFYVKPVKEIFEYTRLEKSKEEAINIRSEIIKELKVSSSLSDADFKEKQNKLDELGRVIEKLEKRQNDLFRKYLSNHEGQQPDYAFFPNLVEVRAVFKKLYDGENTNESLRILSNGGLSIGHSTSSIYSEFVSGNLKIFRVSMGMMVSASNGEDPEKSKEDEAYQRLVSYGGNTVLNFDYPALYYSAVDKKANLIGNINFKGSCDIPAMGTKTEDWAGSGSLGLNLYGDLSTENDRIRFFGSFGIRQIFGTRLFRKNLGVDKESITFAQLDLGLVILKNVKISFTVFTFSNIASLQNRNVIMGAQVMQ